MVEIGNARGNLAQCVFNVFDLGVGVIVFEREQGAQNVLVHRGEATLFGGSQQP